MARILPVRRPFERIKLNVCNQSSRHGLTPRLIVLHDTESHTIPGDGDIKAIGAWFDNPAAQASSHVCVDDEGRSACYVADEAKAWHVVNYNSASLGIEQIGYATQRFWPEAQLKKVAKYIAYWSKKYDIQIERRGEVANGTVVVPGVVTHADLGALGGGHHDPGDFYPVERVLHMARYYRRRGWLH
jgi:N-acetyl-anhydromuramyl-L-alanine amidase AmpD